MKKFIITEDEKKHIMGLYERIGDPLSSGAANSPLSKITKSEASFLNQYYKINLPAATTGNWKDKDFNEYLKKFMEEKQIPVWICKKGDGYCHDDDEGQVTTKDINKLRQAMSIQQPNVQEKINTTNDKSYDYKLSNGKYYYTKKGMNQWVEATGKSLESIKSKVKF